MYVTNLGKFYTVSSRLYAQFWKMHIPLFGPNVILKSAVTQCKICITIMLTTTFILIWLETLCTYMREDTVVVKHFHNLWPSMLALLKCMGETRRGAASPKIKYFHVHPRYWTIEWNMGWTLWWCRVKSRINKKIFNHHITCELMDGTLIDHIIHDSLLASRYHATYQPQTMPHLCFLIVTTTRCMKTVALTTKVIYNNKKSLGFQQEWTGP